MAQALLVTVDVPLGAEVLKALDAAGLKPSVAMWAYLSEYEEWRLFVASRELDRAERSAYSLIFKALDAAGLSGWRAPDVFVFRMDDPFIKKLRREYAKTGDNEGRRIGSFSAGYRYLEDSYVYRIV
jgi:hypothetical protein